MYHSLIYFNERSRLSLELALDLFKSSHQINFFFGKILFEKDDSQDVSFDSFNESPVCFVGCIDSADQLTLNDFLRALMFRVSIFN